MSYFFMVRHCCCLTMSYSSYYLRKIEKLKRRPCHVWSDSSFNFIYIKKRIFTSDTLERE